MRKAIIAAIVASALFAVGAFAASFTVDADDIASGSESVEACADLVEITFAEPQDSLGGVWTVNGATATFFNLDDTTPPAKSAATECAGFDADLALDLDGVTLDGTAEASVDYTNVTVTDGGATTTAAFSFSSPINVEQILNASVVVDGKFLTTNS